MLYHRQEIDFSSPTNKNGHSTQVLYKTVFTLLYRNWWPDGNRLLQPDMACGNQFYTFCHVSIARTHGCMWNDSETHKTVLLDCTTDKTGVQSSNASWVRFTVISHTLMHSRFFFTHIVCINWIEMALVWLIWYTLCYIFFKFAICFIALMKHVI